MKKIILLPILLINLIAFCQQITINKIYNENNKAYYGNAITSFGNNYLIASTGYDSLTPFSDVSVVFMFKVDSVGNFTRVKRFDALEVDYYSFTEPFTLSKTHDSGYIFTMFTRDFINSAFSLSDIIIRLNSNLDTMWTKSFFPKSQTKNIINTIESSDHGFVCIGKDRITNIISNIILIKTDSLANKKWEKTINLGKRCIASHIIETSDKGFLIAGTRSTYGIKDSDPFVVKTDSAGNMLWYRILGGIERDENMAAAINSQGEILIAYGYSTYSDINYLYTTGKLNVTKLDSYGNTIWDKQFDKISRDYKVNKIRILPSNDFIVMGTFIDTNSLISSLFTTSYLYKFNSNGDSIIRKTYYYSNDFLNENILIDNVLNLDGSITAIGYVLIDTAYPSQNIWLLKTDTLLNAPGCYPTGIEEYCYTPKGELSIFPNPATTQTTITYPIAEKAITLQFYNMLGQLVYEEKLSKGSSQITIDARAYKKGLYKVVAGESSGTLVVQ